MHRYHQPTQQKLANKPLLQRLQANTKDAPNKNTPQNLVDLDVLYEDIRQNLEGLLNSRLRYINNLIEFPELRDSLVAYGLNDFMHSSFGSKSMQEKLCKEIENIVSYFEPRIANAVVHLQNSEDDISRILKIRIEGTVKALNEKVPAVFESSMDLNKHNFNFEQ